MPATRAPTSGESVSTQSGHRSARPEAQRTGLWLARNEGMDPYSNPLWVKGLGSRV